MPGFKNKIDDAVNRLNLDLSGKVVLTEAATGAYIVTPVIAALAGAEVYAFTKDTRYGTVADVRKQTNELIDLFSDKKLNVTIIDKLSPEIIAKADIITNSGHLRPLNNEKLQHSKKGVVIPLMYEAWEWRDADLDIEFCKKNGIVVGATNERHPDVDVFNYLGDMALKMIFDAGLCPYKNSFILLCNNDFGPFIAKVLSKVCGALGVCDTAEHRADYEGLDIDWLGNFPGLTVPEKYRKSEAVLFTAYPFDQAWIGSESLPIAVRKISEEVPGAVLLRYAGDIDEMFCKQHVSVYPDHVHSGHMGILPSAIGPDPIVRLQSGGLKVGELLLKKESNHKGLSLVDLIP
jgi:hypothetical protein